MSKKTFSQLENSLTKLAIIIPLRPGERAWQGLMANLITLPAGLDLVFVGPQPPYFDADKGLTQLSGTKFRISWLRSPVGRGVQLNLGARATGKEYLWFLHADSQFTAATLPALRHHLDALERKTPGKNEKLLYFDLAFYDAKKKFLLTMTMLGAYLRSRYLGLPFGDQGFCMPRVLWQRLGGFPEDVAYGEDHLLIWRAHQRNIPVQATGARLLTSSRKYVTHGWLQTTAKHFWLTWKQALPEFYRYLRRERGRSHERV